MGTPEIYVGTAGWSIGRQNCDHFMTEGSHLARYARTFNCVEINSSFYRDHLAKTYARWREEVPEGFRFAVKMPRRFTHEQKLKCGPGEGSAWFQPVSELKDKLGIILVQLPPSQQFDVVSATSFFSSLRDICSTPIACEPRHASWINHRAAELFSRYQILKVEADPEQCMDGPKLFVGQCMHYYRLHGQPKVYYSRYEKSELCKRAVEIKQHRCPSWIIFDNTAESHAVPNAAEMRSLLL